MYAAGRGAVFHGQFTGWRDAKITLHCWPFHPVEIPAFLEEPFRISRQRDKAAIGTRLRSQPIMLRSRDGMRLFGAVELLKEEHGRFLAY